MKKTCRAMQIARPGVLELVERQTPQPGQGEVLIEVEACGLCGADAADIDGADPTLRRGDAGPRMRAGEAKFRMVLSMAPQPCDE